MKKNTVLKSVTFFSHVTHPFLRNNVFKMCQRLIFEAAKKRVGCDHFFYTYKSLLYTSHVTGKILVQILRPVSTEKYPPRKKPVYPISLMIGFAPFYFS